MEEHINAEQCREIATSTNIKIKRLNSVLKSIRKRASKGHRNDCFILPFMSTIHKLALEYKLRSLGFGTYLDYENILNVEW